MENRKSRIEIIRAFPIDAATLTNIAFAAKRHWRYPERWIEHWRDALTITPDYIAANPVYAAVVDARIVGFYSINGAGEKLLLENLWVLPEMLGRGIGRALVGDAVARAKKSGAKRIEIESDPNAEGFYLRMGARRSGERVTEIEGDRRELPILIFGF